MSTVSGCIKTFPRATAVRTVLAFLVTSTILALPFSSRWDIAVIKGRSFRHFQGKQTIRKNFHHL
jgi:hypothetical protein